MANANVPLPDLLRERLRAAPGGRLTWAEVMRLALYEPGVGYYRQGVRRIGRKGDFYTSVSVGPLFGGLLAEFAYQTWGAMGRPEQFLLVEQGAHDGTLANDILNACATMDGEFFASLRYHIIEPDPLLRAAQQATLSAFGDRINHGSEIAEREGLFLCNELLDAFPVHRVRWNGQEWRELWVCEKEGTPSGFEFAEGELSTHEIEVAIGTHGPDLPEGWTTEVCPAVARWLDEVARLPFKGTLLLLDYGFTKEEHFALERGEGTLRRYRQHRMDDRMLEDLGDADLTAHVDFTYVEQLAKERGLTVAEFTEQGRFLTRLFMDAFARHGVAPDPATQRQFHTLTHPSHMGRQFHALVLRKE